MKERKTLFDYFKAPKKKEDSGETLDRMVDLENSRNSTGILDLKEHKRICKAPSPEEREEAADGSKPIVPSDVEPSYRSNKGLGKEEKEEKKTEERYKFLEDIRDRNGRRVGEEGYDPSTLLIPKSEYNRFTPFEKQFWDIKKDHFDTIVFFKKGKFYELYENDALIGAKLFDLRITDRVNMKMSGFPESSLDYWTRKFLENGYKIARVDQSENMIGKQIRERDELSKGVEGRMAKDKIIRRELKEIITQGTIYNIDYMKSSIPMYLMSVATDEICYAEKCNGEIHTSVLLYDASIGEVYFSSFCDDRARHGIKTILSQHDVREMIADFTIPGIPRVVPDKTGYVSSKKYEFSNSREYVCFQYLAKYMEKLRRSDALKNVKISKLQDEARTMVVDDATLRNMEIFKNNYNGTGEKTLFKAIDFSSTPFGQRLLRRWIAAPLVRREDIAKRQETARMFKEVEVSNLKNALARIGDGERLLTRLFNGNPGTKDLNKFIRCLDACREAGDVLVQTLKGQKSDSAESMVAKAEEFSREISKVLEWHRKIYDVSETEISPGEEDGDELCQLMKERREIEEGLNEYLREQKARLKCQSIKFKDVGKDIFQMEVAKETKVPSDYFIMSSTKGTNRYYTRDLKNLVERYVECEEKIFQSKGSLLRRAIDVLLPHVVFFRQMFWELANVDCYLSFTTFSQRNRATTPTFSEGLRICGMSNPIYPTFVANDYNAQKRILVLTGANMGGKSTLLRTLCFNVILSQAGMDVCCEKMETPLFDRIFTRIGARDDLVKGESTFMVELGETASILKHSTRNSLVMMDELGRGTSTRDGECIARAVLDYLKERGCHVLFSTHYHRIIREVEGVSNGYMNSTVKGKDIVFLYKLMDGTSWDSHGLYVARMAGVPEEIVERAERIKETLQRSAGRGEASNIYEN
ncbi:MutS-like DNA mismatch repair protein [Encephalitozoon intestinalis ATCC 50506]|uniref:MutS-like DNA mismatch repair protein n=1 Tax=Encephalitozoon intestinalis (strain ATCC 50506) TaxID=876142 RepID=E0S9K7_ENCIT|nr:MutS-like DNA mismatch repair protein [Encephalitozoon intestinalis ATCC 50506]ADM12392.1 MutS-like DNA mismatch repair protein [Encephalitozoon intestinalis ATCC 50506]UTX46224.1 DNA mismatch repair ATPase Msh6 [Encephalitozoon intestinalis]